MVYFGKICLKTCIRFCLPNGSMLELCVMVVRFGFVEADGKNNNKASATRSKHSVTEQRRRSKINERFFLVFRCISILVWFPMEYNGVTLLGMSRCK